MVSKPEFIDAVAEMIRRAETRVPADVTQALESCLVRERVPVAKLQLKLALKNLQMAKRSVAPVCQDTGIFSFFVKGGANLGFDIAAAVRKAVEIATKEVPLRGNAVDPITRKPYPSNTGPFQPAVHIEPAGGSGLEIRLLVKGAGTENYSRLFMLKPTAGVKAIHHALSMVLAEAGGKICPPVVAGIGIGGSAEVAPMLAKKALLRSISKSNPDRSLARLERELERSANQLGVGPMGLGGRCTVLRVFVERAACHTATLPVAMAFQCWPARRAKAELARGKLKVVEP
ncbi:MAG: fumarate hydratase [Candidatus Hadarchaeota archaeon]